MTTDMSPDADSDAEPTIEAPAGSLQSRPPSLDLDDPALYTNRELSWLEFNQRVLAEADRPANPLLERVRFLGIAANNLDEFFMVRVSGLRQQVRARVKALSPDGRTVSEQLDAVDARCRRMLDDMTARMDVLAGELEAAGIGFVAWDDVDDDARAELGTYFRQQVFPVLTPLAVDPAHPFPYISNLSLNLAVVIHDPADGRELFARVKVPTGLLPRFVQVPGTTSWLPTEQLVAAHLGMLFPGMDIGQVHPFRVVRDADVAIEEDEAEDLLDEIESVLRQRRFRSVVLVQVPPTMPDNVRSLLRRELEIDEAALVETPGLQGLAELLGFVDDIDRPDLLHKPWVPQTLPAFVDPDGDAADVFAQIRTGDILVHHPYESFSTTVEEFILQAVDDPDVLAIKQTLYRTTENSSIMRGLVRAAEAGKQVVVVVELKARFDEERNILWARRLEKSGAHVAYGLVGLKTHAKCVLVVRAERDGIRRYVHIGTGNYNASTARVYEDLGLLSCRDELGADLSDLFNFLTGYSRQRDFRRLAVAPYGLRAAFESRIAREIEHARSGRPARIEMKVNSLVDQRMIRGLYEASQAGVDIDLVVRGICCLQPGIPGISDRIRVRSVIGRFLEHSRIYHFHNDGRDEYLIGSADLMPRNLDRRVEADVPVDDPVLQHELQFILDTCLGDRVQAWELLPGNVWKRVAPVDPGSGTDGTDAGAGPGADTSATLGTHRLFMRRTLDRERRTPLARHAPSGEAPTDR